MSDHLPADLLRRLQDGVGAELLAALPAYQEGEALRLAQRLRGEGHDPELVAAALTQSRLRARARPRLGDLVDDLLLTADGSEQATRPPVAARRARRLAGSGVEHVHDLGCGLGLDALALAEAGLAVTAVESDPTVAAAARANLSAHPAVRVVEGDADAVTVPPDQGAFLDPARRTPGLADASGRTRRLTRLEDLSPSWSRVQQVAAQARATVAKLSPTFPRGQVPEGTLAEWVSLDGDVLECTLWWGAAVDAPGRAAIVGRTGPAGVLWHEVLAPAGAQPDRLGGEGDLQPWIAEPDRAVLASGLTHALSHACGGRELDTGTGYVTAGEPVDLPWARWYAVREVLPLHPKAVRGWLRSRSVASLTVKKRGVRTDPEAFRRDLRLPRRPTGDEDVTLVLTSVAGTPRVLVVEPR